jgi:hypothetical protein
MVGGRPGGSGRRIYGDLLEVETRDTRNDGANLAMA